MVETVDNMDRISELPHHIIHHIMSYLSAVERAKISILSTRWKGFCASCPIFDFHPNNFLRKGGFYLNDLNFEHLIELKRIRKRIKKFIKFIDISLDRFCETKLCIQKFRLVVGVLDVEKSFLRVDRWIGLALENGVKELELEVMTDGSKVYCFPEAIFSAKSVTTLKLTGSKLELLSDIKIFNSLKHLSLVKVYINEQLIQRLTSECPLLEDLLLSECMGLKRFCVSKADKLKVINVETFPDSVLESVEIDVPSLRELDLCFPGSTSRFVDLIRCSHLKKLTLGYVGDPDKELITDKEFPFFISKFPLLEDLDVHSFFNLKKIAISCNWLKNLIIDNCRHLEAIDIDTPKLLFLRWCPYYNSIPSASINAPCLWNVNLRLTFHGVLTACWFRKLKEFLESFNQIEELTISVTSDESRLDSDEHKGSSSSPLCQVRNLELWVDVPPSDYLAWLDGFLSSCYPRTLTIGSWGDEQRKFLMWLWETLKSRDSICRNSNHIKYWQHHLKEIKRTRFLVHSGGELNIDSLVNIWSNLPQGVMEFDLDWSEAHI